jgi:hypothetical protein
MERTAALGFSVHSGLAAVVATAGPAESPTLLHRGRIELIDNRLAGVAQPYHRAVALNDLTSAAAFVRKCADEARKLARIGIAAAVSECANRGYTVVACAVTLSSGRMLTSLEKILKAHPAIHTAEGEHFRRAVMEAAEELALPVLKVKAREVPALAAERFRLTSKGLDSHLAACGKQVGPPWQQDQKLAYMAAWLALADTAGVVMKQVAAR